MRMVDEQRYPDRSQSPVGCVEEGIGGQVVLRTYPLAFQHAPQGLRDVEMRRVRREVEEEKPSAFPDGSHLLHDTAAVDAGVVKHDDGVPFPGSKGQPVEEVRQLLGGNAAPRGEAHVAVVPGRHAEYVEACYLLGRDVDILSPELPAVGDIALRADMALRRHRRGLSSRLPPFVQVLAVSRPCTRRAAARVFPLGVSLYAYILRQC